MREVVRVRRENIHVYQSIEQERAGYAWGRASENKTKEYLSVVNKMPAMIMVNGLGQTLAFLLSKSKGEEGAVKKEVYEHFSEWLKGAKTICWESESQGIEDISERLTRVSSATYRQATKEALKLSIWLKRFATGLVEE